jgi:hypothetical protein
MMLSISTSGNIAVLAVWSLLLQQIVAFPLAIPDPIQPQPLPPGIDKRKPIQPQPLPPGVDKRAPVSPQPIPTFDKRDAEAVSPQPVPPIDRRADTIPGDVFLDDGTLPIPFDEMERANRLRKRKKKPGSPTDDTGVVSEEMERANWLLKRKKTPTSPTDDNSVVVKDGGVVEKRGIAIALPPHDGRRGVEIEARRETKVKTDGPYNTALPPRAATKIKTDGPYNTALPPRAAEMVEDGRNWGKRATVPNPSPEETLHKDFDWSKHKRNEGAESEAEHHWWRSLLKRLPAFEAKRKRNQTPAFDALTEDAKGVGQGGANRRALGKRRTTPFVHADSAISASAAQVEGDLWKRDADAAVMSEAEAKRQGLSITPFVRSDQGHEDDWLWTKRSAEAEAGKDGFITVDKHKRSPKPPPEAWSIAVVADSPSQMSKSKRGLSAASPPPIEPKPRGDSGGPWKREAEAEAVEDVIRAAKRPPPLPWKRAAIPGAGPDAKPPKEDWSIAVVGAAAADDLPPSDTDQGIDESGEGEAARPPPLPWRMGRRGIVDPTRDSGGEAGQEMQRAGRRGV